MIRCLPRGPCSWNFVLDGEGLNASLRLDWIGEQGDIVVDGASYVVRKESMFTGRWTLHSSQKEEIASAEKFSAFMRRLEIKQSLDRLVVRPKSAVSRTFFIERGPEVIARVSPDHAFTRRASIEVVSENIERPVLAFAFWLVVLMWRRSSSSSSGAAAS